MGRSRYRIYDSSYPYSITSSIVEGYPIFSNQLAAQIILDALEFIQNKRSTAVYAYVIMENHIHLILQNDHLPQLIQAFKSWTARSIVDLFSENGNTFQLYNMRKSKKPSHNDSVHQLWQEGYYPKQIFNDEMMIQKIEYIHNNPVKRGFVDHPEDWRYSSMRNYLGMESLIPITLFEL